MGLDGAGKGDACCCCGGGDAFKFKFCATAYSVKSLRLASKTRTVATSNSPAIKTTLVFFNGRVDILFISNSWQSIKETTKCGNGMHV